jgi:hypothetical protein
MKRVTLLAGTGLAMCVTFAFATQDTKEASAIPPEAMARMAPGQMHAKLKPLIGTWNMTGKFRMSADAPWQELNATVEREWILGERFIEEEVESEVMGQPFEGKGIIGYDNTRQVFTMVWVENMSTGTWVSTGRMEGNTLVFEGENSDAMTGEKSKWGKSVLDLSSDKHTFKGYAKDSSGKEYQNMEMVETKK